MPIQVYQLIPGQQKLILKRLSEYKLLLKEAREEHKSDCADGLLSYAQNEMNNGIALFQEDAVSRLSQKIKQCESVLQHCQVRWTHIRNAIEVGTVFRIKMMCLDGQVSESTHIYVDTLLGLTDEEYMCVESETIFGKAVFHKQVGDTFVVETDRNRKVTGTIEEIYPKEIARQYQKQVARRK